MRTTQRGIIILLALGAAMSAALAQADARPGLGGGPGRRVAVAAPASDALARLPLYFVENAGQADPDVRFLARAGGHAFRFTDRAIQVSSANGRTLRVRFDGAREGLRPVGRNRQQALFHYLLGSDSARWTTGAASCAEVAYDGVYPGIDLVYRGDARRVKYEFVVAAGGDPSAIRLAYEGVESVTIEEDGSLSLRLGDETLHEERPLVFQRRDGGAVPVEGRYRVAHEGDSWSVGFDVGAYDRHEQLVIDPVLAYASYQGGNGNDWVYGWTRDAAGNLYACGETLSTDYPTTAGAYQTTPSTVWDGYLYKLDPTGRTLLFGTYLGGTGNDDALLGVCLDPAGNLCLTGWTNSTDFPVVSPFQATYGGGRWDGFVAKLTPDGAGIVYSSYLGGTVDDWGNGLAVDAAGDLYVNGNTNSADFPTVTPMSAYAAGWDCFVTKVSSAGPAIAWSTFVGGTGDEYSWGRCIQVDSVRCAYVTFYTASTDFPTRSAIQGANAGGFDGVVARINASGTGLAFSTYLGGTLDDFLLSLAIDEAGNIYVAGQTYSTDFPTMAPIQAANAGLSDGLVAKLAPNGASLLFSTFLGGSGNDGAQDLVLDLYGNLHIAGYTQSADFPTRFPSQAALGGGWDAFVTRMDPRGRRILSSTYVGGSADEYGEFVLGGPSGESWLIGDTTSVNFPTVNPRQAASGGSWDSFVARLAPAAPELAAEVVVGQNAWSGGGYCEIARDGLSANAHEGWVRLANAPYNAANGETHVACGDVDRDGWDEMVVGFGTYPASGGWMAVFDDRAAGYALIAWIRVPWSQYDAANGAVWPACGDLDGDGADEIVAGLGTYRPTGGNLVVFDDARHSYAFRRFIQLQWNAYNAANGETRPACGDVDGDGRAEIVVGTGSYPAAGGWCAVFEDEATANAFSRWVRLSLPAYDAADGQVWPACGDVDGDGRAEVLLGTGPYRANGGWVQVRDDATTGYAASAWLRVQWTPYNAAVGEARPACGDLDGDGRDEVLLGLGPYPAAGGYTMIADDQAGGFSTLRWIRMPWVGYDSAVGATRPAAGNLGD